VQKSKGTGEPLAGGQASGAEARRSGRRNCRGRSRDPHNLGGHGGLL